MGDPVQCPLESSAALSMGDSGIAPSMGDPVQVPSMGDLDAAFSMGHDVVEAPSMGEPVQLYEWPKLVMSSGENLSKGTCMPMGFLWGDYSRTYAHKHTFTHMHSLSNTHIF